MTFTPETALPLDADKQTGDPIAPQFEKLQDAVEELRGAGLATDDDLDGYIPVGQAAAVDNVSIDSSGDGTFTLDVGAAQPITVHVAGFAVVGGSANLPDVAAVLDDTSGDIPLTVTLDVSGSTAATGAQMASYAVSFGDGTSPVTVDADDADPGIEHTYTTAGTYTVTVVGTDTLGRQSTVTAGPVTATEPAVLALGHTYLPADLPASGTDLDDGMTWPDSSGDPAVPLTFRGTHGAKDSGAPHYVLAGAFGAGVRGVRCRVVRQAFEAGAPLDLNPAGSDTWWTMSAALRDMEGDTAKGGTLAEIGATFSSNGYLQFGFTYDPEGDGSPVLNAPQWFIYSSVNYTGHRDVFAMSGTAPTFNSGGVSASIGVLTVMVKGTTARLRWNGVQVAQATVPAVPADRAFFGVEEQRENGIAAYTLAEPRGFAPLTLTEIGQVEQAIATDCGITLP